MRESVVLNLCRTRHEERSPKPQVGLCFTAWFASEVRFVAIVDVYLVVITMLLDVLFIFNLPTCQSRLVFEVIEDRLVSFHPEIPTSRVIGFVGSYRCAAGSR